MTKLHPETPFLHPLAEHREWTDEEMNQPDFPKELASVGDTNDWFDASHLIENLRKNPVDMEADYPVLVLVKQTGTPFNHLWSLMQQVRQHEISAMEDLCALIVQGFEIKFPLDSDEE